ncbi:polysaccharide biosynthesis C-terminal domain-containing protein [Devosia sp. A449]
MKRIVVTGAGGLIGWHASARLHAANCAARFKGEEQPYDLVLLDRASFADAEGLARAVSGADVILHFAGVNRGPQDEVESVNPGIATALLAAISQAQSRPQIVYANSTHAIADSPYGRSKRGAAEQFAASGLGFTNLILPHIFGECARPYYNNVTATLIDQVIKGETPTINPNGVVYLLHAGAAAQIAIDAGAAGATGDIFPSSRTIGVPALYEILRGFHESYGNNVFPSLSEDFEVALFNSYRAALYPSAFPRPLKLNTDKRGTLFEAVKGGSGGQSFASWTEPGVTRGDHFHLKKVERFLVLDGEAIIRIRRVLGEPVWEYRVSGANPSPVDMPTLHTHSIENVGDRPLLTLFWTHEMFDPMAPDTYADQVLGA